jgi:uncharacterized caspase-like protein
MTDLRFVCKGYYSHSRALVVGIDRYKKASPLAHAVNDAKLVKDVLTSRLGFPAGNVTLLVNDEATAQGVRRHYFDFAQSHVDVDDRIFVFYAGHGHTTPGNNGDVGFLIPYDGDVTDFSTLIPWDEFLRGAALIRAKHLLFVMDACYGGLFFNRSAQPSSSRFLRDMLLRRGRQAIAAGKADQPVADGGGPLPGHSIFTGHLVEGLQGKAATTDGIITASGLMAYVYNRVASDPHSRQTPHHGHLEGDGDFILLAPALDELPPPTKTPEDILLTVPASAEPVLLNSTDSKLAHVKTLLASDASAIPLHDFLVREVKRFHAATADDSFSVGTTYSDAEFLSRLTKYEDASLDLSLCLACVAHWGKHPHRTMLQKILARSCDRLVHTGGQSTWLALRWYPIVLELYSTGIACLDAQNFHSLSSIFSTSLPVPLHTPSENTFVEGATAGLLGLLRSDSFKSIPGHEKNIVPISEYLFKLLQPPLEDAFFMGSNYEAAFDSFEVMLGLVVMDQNVVMNRGHWGPIGRYGWKHWGPLEGGPLRATVTQGRLDRENWAPIRAGLFGGSFDRFDSAAEHLIALVDKSRRF